MKDPDLLLRHCNKYEIDIGTFENWSPETENLWAISAAELTLIPERQKASKTVLHRGTRREGIRFLKQTGVSEVFQLDGGTNHFERKDGRSKEHGGRVLVFDQRPVTKDLKQGRYEQCYVCRHPISSEELKSADYEKGVSCPRCIDQVSER